MTGYSRCATDAYASVLVEFVDRETGQKTAVCYPVIRVVLMRRDRPDVGPIAFVATDTGTWALEPTMAAS